MCWVERDGAQHGAPYRQGDLDSLCGLYATVNALRVALAPTRALKRREAQELFVAGLAYLNRGATLHEFSAAGMSPATLHRLAKHLSVRASQVTGTKVSVARPPRRPWKRAVLLRTIDDALGHGAPVIVGLEQSYDHYTVITGATAARYRLFDSGRLQWIARDSLGVPGSQHRHQLSVGSVLVVVPGR